MVPSFEWIKENLSDPLFGQGNVKGARTDHVAVALRSYYTRTLSCPCAGDNLCAKCMTILGLIHRAWVATDAPHPPLSGPAVDTARAYYRSAARADMLELVARFQPACKTTHSFVCDCHLQARVRAALAQDLPVDELGLVAAVDEAAEALSQYEDEGLSKRLQDVADKLRMGYLHVLAQVPGSKGGSL